MAEHMSRTMSDRMSRGIHVRNNAGWWGSLEESIYIHIDICQYIYIYTHSNKCVYQSLGDDINI